MSNLFEEKYNIVQSIFTFGNLTLNKEEAKCTILQHNRSPEASVLKKKSQIHLYRLASRANCIEIRWSLTYLHYKWLAAYLIWHIMFLWYITLHECLIPETTGLSQCTPQCKCPSNISYLWSRNNNIVCKREVFQYSVYIMLYNLIWSYI